MHLISVAINTPLYQTFDYLSYDELAIGVRVMVPFGVSRICVGVVWDNPKKSDFSGQLKSIIQVLDNQPLFADEMINLLKWSADYYHHPIGEIVFTALPKNLKLGKEAMIKKALKPNKQIASDIKPNNAQIAVIDKVLSHQHRYQSYLLHGITGSGKTEVYIRLAQAMIAQQKQVLILVPEIGLTPQMIKRFSTRLETAIAIIHSQKTPKEKTDAYLLAQSNKVGLVIGTRSAIFTPLPYLGLIILDEEHDDSFKQQSDWRYCAKELSFVRTKSNNIPLLLGSATPSLQTLQLVLSKKVALLNLTQRTNLVGLPKVDMIDMNTQDNAVLSETLLQKMQQHLNNKQQVMLFINRRGYAPIFRCKSCDWQASCQACSVSLVLHQSCYRLKCHHCGYESMPPSHCPSCGLQHLSTTGYGTERLAEVLYAKFPAIEIIRIDKDTTRKKGALTIHLEKINQGKPCIIIGTQMLAKGHDFNQLSLVGVLDADNSLFSSDFRATEKLAQLLMQVAGRAGRGQQSGQVYIQSKQIHHPIFFDIKDHRYLTFAKTLLSKRKETNLPPFSYTAQICINAKQQSIAQDALATLKEKLLSIKRQTVELLGPAPAIIEKKANHYYVNLYVISKNRKDLHTLLECVPEQINTLKNNSKWRWFLDINPLGY